jgi:hypothetical protein
MIAVAGEFGPNPHQAFHQVPQEQRAVASMTLSWWVPVAQARLRRCYWAAEVTECCLSTVRFSDQSQAIDRSSFISPVFRT